MDEIFGEDNFRNEIIWKRSTAHNDSTGFANLHDTIFYYSMSNDLYFDIPMVPYSDEYLEHYYNKQDDDGRKYLDRDLSAKGLKGSGYSYAWKGKEGYWRCPITTMEKLEREGRLYYTSNGTPRYKQYLDEMEGVPALRQTVCTRQQSATVLLRLRRCCFPGFKPGSAAPFQAEQKAETNVTL